MLLHYNYRLNKLQRSTAETEIIKPNRMKLLNIELKLNQVQ